MKAIIQRVKNARVLVNGNLVAEIQQGLCVLIGICNEDSDEDIKFISRKILDTKFFEDEDKKRWMKSVKELDLEILCISQFTLHFKHKGRKLDFSKAMKGEDAQEMYTKLLKHLENDFDASKIKSGIFGAMMEVQISNDGPVTIQIDSKKSSNQE